MATANETVGDTITDDRGHVWTIASDGRIAVDGKIDPTTAAVIKLAYVNGRVWQQNSDMLWYSKVNPSDTWTSAQTASPIPFTPSPDQAVATAASSITDGNGNVWRIDRSGLVTVNNIPDTTTARVTELAFVGGKVWQENADNLWWAKSVPTDTWVQGPNPLGGSVKESPDNTVITQSNQSIVDHAGHTWSIANGKVVTDGVVDQTTANVTTLAYEGGKVWQENADNLWWAKSVPSDTWSPGSGTTTSPIPTGTMSSGYTFTEINVAGASSTAPQGINNQGHIVGTYSVDSHPPAAFEVVNGIIVDRGGGYAFYNDINNGGTIVERTSHYESSPSLVINPDGSVKSYVGNYLTFKAINDSGQIVGSDLRPNGGGSEAIQMQNGKAVSLSIPGSTSSVANDIDDYGDVVGSYKDADGAQHGFVQTSTGTFIPLDVGQDTDLVGVNDIGQILGTFKEGGHTMSFIRAANGTITDIAVAGATDTIATGFNDSGQIVGEFLVPGAIGYRGFEATPTPGSDPSVIFNTATTKIVIPEH